MNKTNYIKATKTIFFSILSLLSSSVYSETCPLANDIHYIQGEWNSPTGWSVLKDYVLVKNLNLNFITAFYSYPDHHIYCLYITPYDEEQKTSTLLTVMGEHSYSVLKNYLWTTEPADDLLSCENAKNDVNDCPFELFSP
jgi:hypothetical protein